jgi:poly(3-hydroxybutyrate) depolymerase
VVSLPVGYDPSVAYPLVFVWHGPCQTADEIASGSDGDGFMGLAQLAGATAILVAGQGLADPDATIVCADATSPDQSTMPCGWTNLAGSDVAFTEAMLDELASDYCVDQNRVFSTGLSSGGMMSDTVGCALGDRFRAIAPIMPSGIPGLTGTDCVGQVAVWLTHGRNDDVVAFAFGVASRDYWLTANNCSTSTDAVGPDECVEYLQCDPGAPVVWCPSSESHSPPSYAAEAIWDFFSSF